MGEADGGGTPERSQVPRISPTTKPVACFQDIIYNSLRLDILRFKCMDNSLVQMGHNPYIGWHPYRHAVHRS